MKKLQNRFLKYKNNNNHLPKPHNKLLQKDKNNNNKIQDIKIVDLVVLKHIKMLEVCHKTDYQIIINKIMGIIIKITKRISNNNKVVKLLKNPIKLLNNLIINSLLIQDSQKFSLTNRGLVTDKIADKVQDSLLVQDTEIVRLRVQDKDVLVKKD